MTYRDIYNEAKAYRTKLRRRAGQQTGQKRIQTRLAISKVEDLMIRALIAEGRSFLEFEAMKSRETKII